MQSTIRKDSPDCKIAVVVLGWNGLSLLQDFFPSVVAHSADLGTTVFYVDNHSADDSVSWVQTHYPTVQIIKLPHNLGYAGGYNEALKSIQARYYMLLNQDVEVPENWLHPLESLLDSDPTVWAAQPKILAWKNKSYFEYAGAAGGMVDWLGYPFCRGRMIDVHEKDVGQYEQTTPIFWASGAALFIRADAFHRLGGFEPTFFAHQEEIDLCWRLQKDGGRILYEPHSFVYHLGGGSLDMESPRKTYLNFRNNLLMLVRNLPATEILPILSIRLLLDFLAALTFLFQGKASKTKAVLKAYLSFLKRLPGQLANRKPQVKNVKRFPGSLVWAFYMKKKKTYSDWIRS